MVKNLHEAGNPEVTIDEKADSTCTLTEALNDPGHQIPNDDQIANTNPEALDSYCRIEYDGGIGVGDLGKGEKGSGSSLEISGASRLEVKTKACGKTGPQDDEDSQEDSHARKSQGHSQHTGAND